MDEKNLIREIDVVGLCKKVWESKKSLYWIVGTATVIGVVVALCSPKTYTATVSLIPELSSDKSGLSGTLSSVASSFGVDLSTKNGVDALYPEIYPEIFISTDFVRELFNISVRLHTDNTPRTYLEHLRKDVRMPFWDYPIYWLKLALRKPEPAVKGQKEGEVDPYRMSRVDATLCENISNSISCLVDDKTSEISISFTDQDPVVAAIVVDTLQHRLQAYITDYKTKKARVDYDYYLKLSDEAFQEYKLAEQEFSSFSDSHRNASLVSVSAHQTALENKMSNTYSTYTAMTNLRDQARAKIQDRTPAFTVIQSAKMPHKPSSRPKLVTLFIFVFLGCLVDVAWVAWKRGL